MVPTVINGRWKLSLPQHRAERPQWNIANGGWETARIFDIADHLGVPLNGGHRIFDIGAEEGDMPGLWALLGAHVVCVEPNPLVWPNIRAIFESNELPTPGWFVGFAGAERRDDHDDRPEGWPACAYGAVVGDHGFCQLNERPDIPVTTIDALAARYGPPTLVTIDVEGSELEVLRGASATLLNYRPTVWVSVHHRFMLDQYATDPGELFELMDRYGYQPTFLAHDHETHWRFDPT